SRGALLPLPLPAAAAPGARAVLRRGRRPGRPARDRRLAAGERGAEADHRRRRSARRTAAALRRAPDRVQRGHAEARSRLPRLRREPDDHGVRRLRRVLRRTAGARMTTVRIPPTLRAEVGGERQVPAQGETVRAVLEDLTSRFPGLGQQLFEDGEIATFVNVYVEGED